MAVKDKIFSGRYFSTIMVVSFYCILMAGAGYLVYLDKLETDAFMGLFTAFSSTATLVIKSYFDRTDRKEHKDGNTGKVGNTATGA